MRLDISELMRQQGNLSNSQNDMKILLKRFDNLCNNVKFGCFVQANHKLKG